MKRLISPILSTVAKGYINAQFVGNVLFPTVYVPSSGGQIIAFGKDALRRLNARRTPGSNTKRVPVGFSGETYALVQDGLEGQVPYEDIRNIAVEAPGIDLGRKAVVKTMDALLLALEYDQAKMAIDPAKYDENHKVTLSGTDQWTHAESDPGAVIEAGRNAVRASIGLFPNVAVFSAVAFAALVQNAKIIDRMKYTSKESITPDMIAALFEFEKVVVGGAVEETGDGSMTDIWGDNVVLAYTPQVPTAQADRGTPSYGYTYMLDGHPAVEQPYEDRNAKSWIYPVTIERAPVVSMQSAAYLIRDVSA